MVTLESIKKQNDSSSPHVLGSRQKKNAGTFQWPCRKNSMQPQKQRYQKTKQNKMILQSLILQVFESQSQLHSGSSGLLGRAKLIGAVDLGDSEFLKILSHTGFSLPLDLATPASISFGFCSLIAPAPTEVPCQRKPISHFGQNTKILLPVHQSQTFGVKFSL